MLQIWQWHIVTFFRHDDHLSGTATNVDAYCHVEMSAVICYLSYRLCSSMTTTWVVCSREETYRTSAVYGWVTGGLRSLRTKGPFHWDNHSADCVVRFTGG